MSDSSRAAFAKAFTKAISAEGHRMAFARMLAREDGRYPLDRSGGIALNARVKTWANTLRRWETQKSLPRNLEQLRQVTRHLDAPPIALRLEELWEAARKEDVRPTEELELQPSELTPAAVPSAPFGHALIWRDTQASEWLDRQILHLGDPSPIIRLSALHFLLRLADEWPAGRQDCIDILCGYYRHIAAIGSDLSDADEEARVFLIESVSQRLTSTDGDTWSAYYVDLSRCQIRGFNTTGVRVGYGLSFSEAVFVGPCEFEDLIITPDGVLSLESATIEKPVHLAISQLQGGQLNLSGCRIVAGASLGAIVSVSPHPDPGPNDDDLTIIANDCIVDGELRLIFSGSAAYPTLWIDNLVASSNAEVYVHQDDQGTASDDAKVWAGEWTVLNKATAEIDVSDLDTHGWRVSADAEVYPEYLRAKATVVHDVVDLTL